MIFYSTADAVACARALQVEWRKNDPVPVRIGIHLGDLIKKEGNVFGDSVNIASRIESIGIPGSVLLSEAVRNSVKNQPDLEFQPLGKFFFKNVMEPIWVHALDIDGLTIPDLQNLSGKLSKKSLKKPPINIKIGGALLFIIISLLLWGYFQGFLKSPPPEAEIYSLAVLPFTNLSQDEENKLLSAGFSTEVIYQLSKIESIGIISPSMVRQMLDQNMTYTQIAEKLNLNYILEGTFQKEGNRTRITTNLTRINDKKLIWSEEFDLDQVNLIDAQISVSSNIAQNLPLNLSQKRIDQLQQKATANPLAYELYLKALQSFPDWVTLPQAIDRPVNYLRRAIALDEKFAKAHALLSQAWFWSSVMAGPEKEELAQLAISFAHQAISLDSLLPDPYIVLGNYYNSQNPGSGLKYFAKANELDPKAGLFELGRYYFSDGNYAASYEYYALKRTRDPYSPLGHVGVSEIYRAIGCPDRAISILEKLFDQGSRSYLVLGNLIENYRKTGQMQDAHRIIDDHWMKYDSINGMREKSVVLLFERKWKEAEYYYLKVNNLDMDLALIYLKTGREDIAEEYFNKAIENRSRNTYLGPWPLRDLSRIYAAKGDFEKAYEYFDLLEERNDLHYEWIDKDPFFDEIRNEKRFQEYLERIEYKRREIRNQIRAIEAK